MEKQQTASAATPLPPTETVYFQQAKGEPDIWRVLYALKGVCDTLERAQPQLGRDWEQMNNQANLAIAAAILANHLTDRLTCKPPTAKRRRPRLQAVPAGAPAGAT